MSRLSDAFDRRKREGGAALVTYVMGGDPDLRGSLAMALACVEGGADLLEIGVPFSDPIADGPTIQRAAERALASGTTLKDCLALAVRIRARTQVPIVLMGYLNPILAFGERRFLSACAKAGIDAVIVPDLPPEEAQSFVRLARQHGVAVVFLLAPTSTPQRWQAAFAVATGFIYFVSVAGVTGARTALPKDLGAQLDRVRGESPVPVVVGFGISKPDQARALGRHCDGVVVGSAIVSLVAQPGPIASRAAKVTRFVRSLKSSLDRPHDRAC